MKKVAIGIPTYDGKIDFRISQALLNCAKTTPYAVSYAASSLLAYTFNTLWCIALNARKKGYTHFLLWHADVSPEENFLDKMMVIMEKNGADVLSVCLPVKNNQGLSSTGIDTHVWHPSRFTMRQLAKMPKTFTHPQLLVNTGLMLVDMTRLMDINEICFRIEDRILVDEDGECTQATRPEDWNFSRDMRFISAKIFATTEIKCDHIGHAIYPNQGAWGSKEVDTEYGEAKL